MRTTSKTIAAKLPNCDLSSLPTTNPGGNKLWRYAGATGHQIVVGAFAPSLTVTADVLRIYDPSPDDYLNLTALDGDLLLDGNPIGVTDHGVLTGLGDDDHAQYYNQARGDARYFQKTGGVVSGFIQATGYIDASSIYCDGSQVFDTTGTSLNIGNFGGFTSATILQGGSGSSLLRIGGSNSSYPALKQSGADLQVKLADDSAFANLVATRFYTYNVNGNPSIGSYSNAGIVVYGLTSGTGRGVLACNSVEVDAAYYVYWSGRSCLTSSADGLVHVQNFNLNESVDQVLVFGPGTSSSNGLRLKRPVGTSTLHVKNGNDSAYADLMASRLYTYNVAGSPSIEAYSNNGIQALNHAGALGTIRSHECQVDATGYFYVGSRGIISSSANGVMHVQNYDMNDATANQVLALGPATSASNGVRLKRAMGTTTVQVRNGDDSADASMTVATLTLSGAHNLAPITKASLLAQTPNASTGGRWRVTDSTPANREAYPDGTNWRWASDDTVVV